MDLIIPIIILLGALSGAALIWSAFGKKELTAGGVKQLSSDRVSLSANIQTLTKKRGFWFYFVFGALGGIIIGLLTGWPVMGLCIFISAIAGSFLFGSKAEREAHIAKTEAIATWTEMIRDTIAGASGLEEALIATGGLAPAPIAPEINQFLRRLENQPLDEALLQTADALGHPSADLVITSLVNSVRTQAQNLGDVLTKLATSIRGDVRMRVRVEVGRSKILTSSKIVIGVSLLTILYLLTFARSLLEPYESIGGQLWLFVVFGVFWLGGWLLHFYGRIELPERFLHRKGASIRK